MVSHKELLIRRNKGKIILKEHLHSICSLLNCKSEDISFLDLNTSDAISKRFFDEYKLMSKEDDFLVHYIIPKNDFSEFQVYQFIKAHWNDGVIYWISKYSDFYGVIKMQLEVIENKIVNFIEYDGDSLCLTQGEKSGLMIDYFEDLGEYFYEVSIW